jgi:hypothetical protein
MTPQERQMVDDLFDRLSGVEGAPRDPDAATAIAQGLRKAPNALYALVQTVLVQDEALKRANSRIQELEAAGPPAQNQSGGFLDSMRDTVFGRDPSRGSVPNVPPPAGRPVWNSGQVLQQGQAPGHYDEAPYGQPSPYGQPQPYGAPQGPMGGGGGFLGTAAAAAAGMVGGSLLLNSVRSMMGGNRHGFGDSAGLNNAGSGDKTATPWSDQSNSSLARDAGIDNIGSSSSRADGNSRAGLFDTASNDDQASGDDDDDHDDMDLDSDDGDSDTA